MDQEIIEQSDKCSVKVLLQIVHENQSGSSILCQDARNAGNIFIEAGGEKKSFGCDFCHFLETETESPSLIYQDFGTALVNRALQGYNCCLFAYGPVPAQNACTIIGELEVEAERGLAPRLFKELLLSAPSPDCIKNDALAYRFEMSYVELTNDTYRDLLGPGQDLALKVGNPSKGLHVKGALKVAVESIEHMIDLLLLGQSLRSSSQHGNHTLLTLYVTKTEFDREIGDYLDISSQVCLVEFTTSSSNKPLAAKFEGDVLPVDATFEQAVLAVKEKKGIEVSNPLNYLMGSFFCGNYVTAVAVTVRPEATFVNESLQILEFTSALRTVVNTITIQLDPKSMRIKQLQKQIQAIAAQTDEALSVSSSSPMLRISSSLQQILKDLSAIQQQRERSPEAFYVEDPKNLQQLFLNVQAGISTLVPVLEESDMTALNSVDLPPPPPSPSPQKHFRFEDIYLFEDGSRPSENGAPWIALQKETGLPAQVQIYQMTGTKTDEEKVQEVRNEATYLRQLAHPNIVALLDYFEDQASGEVILVTQNLGPGLMDWLNGLTYYTESIARDAIRGLLRATSHMHENGFVHTKINTSTVRFGVSNKSYDVHLTSFAQVRSLANITVADVKAANSIGFTAPEVIYNWQLCGKLDVWSLGVILYLILSGCHPFDDFGKTPEELEHKVKTGGICWDETIWSHVSPLAKDLVKRMLHVHPTKRPSASELLQHGWICAPTAVLEEYRIPATLEQMKRFSIRETTPSGTPASSPDHSFQHYYELGSMLGQGAYGKVYKCTSSQDGQQYAVKKVDRSTMGPEDLEGLEMEIVVMKEINHRHVVKLVDVFTEGPFSFLVEELVTGGELFDRIVEKTQYNEKEARDLIRTFLNALMYLHNHNIVHRDLKPENLLMASADDNADVKIADFGFATHISTLTQSQTVEVLGTPQYMAPEMLNKLKYTEKVDIWSAGVICYVLLGGYLPFYTNDDNLEVLFSAIKTGTYHFHPERWSAVSDEAKDMIRKMLTVNPTQRWSAEYLLQHSWFHAHDSVLQEKDLLPSVERLRNLRKKFKCAVTKVRALVRLGSSFKKKSEGELIKPDEKKEVELAEVDHTFSGSYETGAELGRGAFGVVYSVTSKNTNQKFAAKVVDRQKMSKQDLEGLELEIGVMRGLKHKHIVQLYDSFVEPKITYLILELVTGGELFDRIVAKTTYNENDAKQLVVIFLKTLHYMHSHDVVHRDLKPENLLLATEASDTDVKVADFGFAVHISALKNMGRPEICGSPTYMAPEMLKGQHYTEKVDIWSAGVIVYILLGGYPPFYAESQTELFNLIKKGVYHFHKERWSHISSSARNLIKKMLEPNPRFRASAADLLKSEPWLKIPEEQLRTRDLQASMHELRKFNARRKLKAAGNAILALGKLSHSPRNKP